MQFGEWTAEADLENWTDPEKLPAELLFVWLPLGTAMFLQDPNGAPPCKFDQHSLLNKQIYIQQHVTTKVKNASSNPSHHAAQTINQKKKKNSKNPVNEWTMSLN